MVSKKVAELQSIITPEDKAAWVSNLWDSYNRERSEVVKKWSEVGEYVFATDTTTTANSKLPWTHKTVLPKLTQIRDNLHANYLSSLFPNDKWLTWVAHDQDSARRSVAETVQSYMENKTREGGYRDQISRTLYDYIDTGNAFAMPVFEARYKETPNEKTPSFIGPRMVRVSPHDIVFNPTATSFEDTWKIVRSMKTLGELQKIANENPEQTFWKEALDRNRAIRQVMSSFSQDDWAKASQYQIDGFGSLQEYYKGDVVEVLEFYGDTFDSETNDYRENRMITIVDRSTVVRDVPIESYGGEALIRHVGWRLRPDNLWAMGPLDNLVGMQYMINHYLNMGANALDLKVMPPKKIIGEVEEFEWMPNAEIHIDENGDVQEMAQQFNDVYTVKDWIDVLEARMELYAGAPREAMGIRSPGEKTAFEVQALENAAGRIFQEKIVQFELFMEKNLNDMLETAHRNMDESDIIRVIDNDVGVQQFREITKASISANGILRPVGARHFAQKAQELQNLVGIFNSPLGQMIAPHTSSLAMTDFVNDVVDLRGYNMFRKNIAVEEAQELKMLANQAAEDADMAQGISEEEIMQGVPQNEDQTSEEQG
jgi:hypothetical protein